MLLLVIVTWRIFCHDFIDFLLLSLILLFGGWFSNVCVAMEFPAGVLCL